MTKSLGNSLPGDLLERLRDRDPSKKESRVIILSTVDENGLPHYAMLSYFEVAATEGKRLLLLAHSNSKGVSNIRRNGALSLLFVDEEFTYYIKTKCSELNTKIAEVPSETVLEARVIEALEDTLPTARITSGIRFEGRESDLSNDSRLKVFENLRNLASKYFLL